MEKESRRIESGKKRVEDKMSEKVEELRVWRRKKKCKRIKSLKWGGESRGVEG